MHTFPLALLALLAFAGNSILCRLALSTGAIDAGSFTVFRLLSGIIMLFLLVVLAGRRQEQGVRERRWSRGSWLGGLSLFVYAVFFSYAYISLDTATGALILFGTVQIALMFYGIVQGQRPTVIEYAGFLTACVGFIYLLWPELSKPGFVGLLLMIMAGIAWAVYTVQGQGSDDPLSDTAYNFLQTAPLLVLLLLLMLLGLLGEFEISLNGLLLAVASGAITSGVGYALWYAALKNMNNTTAAVSQLSVPVFAAIFGVIFADELLSQRLVISACMVLGGILVVILSKQKATTR